MSKRKKIYNDPNASKVPNEAYGTIFESMLKSDAYKRLSPTAKALYICCRVQSQSKDGRECLYRHGKEYGIEYNHNIDFVFPAKHQEKYTKGRQNNDKYFKELIAAGFIIKREKNNYRFKVNVYSFSDKWKNSS